MNEQQDEISFDLETRASAGDIEAIAQLSAKACAAVDMSGEEKKQLFSKLIKFDHQHDTAILLNLAHLAAQVGELEYLDAVSKSFIDERFFFEAYKLSLILKRFEQGEKQDRASNIDKKLLECGYILTRKDRFEETWGSAPILGSILRFFYGFYLVIFSAVLIFIDRTDPRIRTN